ncbi:MAG: domain containing protein [Blastococcus sp.]|nr:domain containing protein [Blastococcus sp.]
MPITTEPKTAAATREWTLVGRDSAVDVEVTAREGDTLATVLTALGPVLGLPTPDIWAGSSRLPDDLPLSAAQLLHGAVLGLGGPVRGTDRTRRSSALELRVVGGPDAGHTVPLTQGSHVLGRGRGASVLIDDPDVSRQHVAVHVGGGAVTVADLGSTNGSRLGDQDLDDRPRPWPTGELLRLGATAVSLAGPATSPAALEPAPGGRLRLRSSARLTVPLPDVEISFPLPPTPPPHRRLAWVAVTLPAVGGLLMALLLHTPTFLFFALLSPVVALGTWLSDRWSGRRSGRRDAAAHALAETAAEHRLAAAAAADVRAREAEHPDLAALTSAARRRSSLLWSRARDDADALTLRVGSGPGDTRVIRVQGDGTRARVRAPHAPVVVDLRASGGLAVVGPPERTSGVLAGLVAQLATLHAPGEVDLLLLTEPDRSTSWSWARWLPHLRPSAVHLAGDCPPGPAEDVDQRDDQIVRLLAAMTASRRLAGAAATGPTDAPPAPSWLVVIVDRPVGAGLRAALRTARAAGVLTLASAESAAGVPAAVDAVLRLTGETGDLGVLSRQGMPDRIHVAVDRLSRAIAAGLARDLAVLLPAAEGGALPTSVRLLDLPTAGVSLDDDGSASGSWSPARDQLVTTLGATAQGPVEIDLCRSGPHALVAGTTGSGKSELLQTLIAGLARNHPPDRCSFLLVDYKGGAAFADAASLPHTVGLLTDLDGQSTARALQSLTAELTRREEILAAHRAADIAELPDTVELARLVIVVDEFATLVEELPTFVPGLISIAQRGRSLGVHLVLATQRPSGVVSPDIRANCTLRICLRTTDEADSRDVLGTPEAALLPVTIPGRAYLRAGSGNLTPFQVARVAAAVPARRGAVPSVRVVPWPRPVGGLAADGLLPAEASPSDLARLRLALSALAVRAGVPRPHRPWRAPLPEQISTADLDAGPDGAPAAWLPLGLVDRPQHQAQDPLHLDLSAGGTWLAVGGPRSGRTTLLRTVLREAVHRLGPDDLHVHVIESGGGSLAVEAAAAAHTGTAVHGGEALRTARLVDRLGREVADRRARGVAQADSEGPPLLLLLIDGIEAVSDLLDEADPGRGSGTLLRLLREGAAVGLTCVVTADRAVPGGRLAALARQRLVLPLPDPADYAVAGVPARAVPGFRPPGRALLGEDAAECQLALPREPDTAPVDGPRRTRPLRIAELPADAVLPPPRPGQRTPPDGGAPLTLPVGPGGDEGSPLVVDLLRTGGLLVTGPPGSGRSTALESFAQHLAATCDLLRLGHPDARLAVATGRGTTWLDPSDAGGLIEWLAARQGRPAVVLADDVGAPTEWTALSALPRPGGGSRVVLIAASGPGQLSGHYQGAVAALRRNRSALLLCPGPGDAELVGVRLPRTPVPERPGSGWLVTGSAMERVQVARRARPATANGPSGKAQSSSSADPISWVAYQASS